MSEQTIEERLNELKQKRDHVGDPFGAADVHTLVEGIEYAMSHGGDVSVAITPVENGYKITITDSEGNTQEATVENGGDAYAVYVSTVPEGQTPMSKDEWLASLKGEKGNDGHNPCLGVFADASFLPTTDVQEGDYAYADVSEVSHIFRYNGSAWVDNGEGSPDNQPKFNGGNGPAVGDMKIDDTHIAKPADNALALAIDIPTLVKDVYGDEEDASDLYVSDEEGNAIVEFGGGHIKTKNFDSRDVQNVSMEVVGRTLKITIS